MHARLLTVALLASFATCAARADDRKPDKPEKKADTSDRYSEMAKKGTGVTDCETDDMGRVKSVFIVGTSHITTALGAARGKEIARQRAELAAKGAFAKWLKEKVSIYTKSESEAILLIEGVADKEGTARRESGKALEKDDSRIETMATAMMRGFKLVHVETSTEDKTLSLVYKWDAKLSSGIEKGDEKGKKTNDGGIKDKKITIDDPR